MPGIIPFYHNVVPARWAGVSLRLRRSGEILAATCFYLPSWCAFRGEFLARKGEIFLPVPGVRGWVLPTTSAWSGRDLAGGEQAVGNRLLSRRRTVIAFCGRRARRVSYGGPMLLRNPFPMHLHSFDRRAADLAGVNRPLLSIPVSGKNFLQVIAELSVARLYGCWHHFPFIWIRCGKAAFLPNSGREVQRISDTGSPPIAGSFAASIFAR